MPDPIEQIRRYHQQTKHYLDAYAKGPQYLDWDQQPNPFRRFKDAPLTELPLLVGPSAPKFPMLDIHAVAALLELSLGLSAWKEFGPDRWALRCNPSSGNLHPTEGYVIANAIDGLDDGVYHYAPHEHALELRGRIASDEETKLQLLIGLSSIYWREAWKYGERAFRYVQLDIGHAIGALMYAARTLGLHVRLLPESDASISQLLGLDRKADFQSAEAEHPEVLLQISFGADHLPYQLPQVQQWFGQANSLGGLPQMQWDIIDEVGKVCACKTTPFAMESASRITSDNNAISKNQWITLIRQRRSAQAFISKQSNLSAHAFYQILRALLPEQAGFPWTHWLLPNYLHPLIFIHRVEGLPVGLYALPRRKTAQTEIQSAMKTDFLWQKPEGCPDAIPLYQLKYADARKAARTISCHQEIAASSSFSLGMLAEFDKALAEGPYRYRQLYWEAGLIGHTLYLEAEKAGMRGTGIGCFFDDSFHALLGLTDSRLQSLYHFTVGYPRIDERLQTLPPYDHLSKERLQS